ncbi:MAG: tetratricopeptide repeat protein, partial [Pseudomonadales bacterium]
YTLAAEQGHMEAQFCLGDIYDKGKGVPINAHESAKWFALSAEQGYANAQSNLGNIYRRGEGVPQNDKIAVKWYTLAAGQNYALAQYALGFMYSKGNAAIRDYKLAYMWYDIAVSNGVVKGIQHKKEIVKGMTPTQIEEAKKMSLRYFKNSHAGD